MEPTADSLLMWLIFLVIILAIVLYASEWVSLQLTSAIVIVVLMMIFHFIPTEDGTPLMDTSSLLSGFADPALITVLCMLVIGEALVRTGGLHHIAHDILQLARGSGRMAMRVMVVFASALSGFCNNTPIVVVFIPMLQSLADKVQVSSSKIMIPLSYAAILGGMTTLIGSSTNLLVSTSLESIGEPPFSMFSFVVPGLVAAVAGLIYVTFIAPWMLEKRKNMASHIIEVSGRKYLTQITIGRSSLLVGETARDGTFESLKDVHVQMVQRGEHAELAPFTNFKLAAGDVLFVVGTRKDITDILTRYPRLHGEIDPADGEVPVSIVPRNPDDQQILIEAMIAPNSRMIGHNLERINFRRRFHCIVLGIQRQSRMIRQRVTQIRLQSGDVLLVRGRRADILSLRTNSDMILIEGSVSEVPNRHVARRALVTMLCVVGLISTNVIPIVLAALLGAVAMLALGCVNIKQASKSIDGRLILLVAAALAMGQSMQVTGGAEYISQAVISVVGTAYPALVLSAFFLLVALVTNVLSNNAAAVLFTPIAVNLAYSVGVSPLPFAVAVVIAANCSFASPIGYQTNLLVMGPGHYRFSDFIRIGGPLLLVIWVVFSIFAPLYYDL